MAASDEEVKQLKLQISASTELLVRNLKSAEAALGEFRRDADRQLDQVDKRFYEVGRNIGSNIRGAIGGVTALFGGVSLVALAKGGLDYASSLGEVSQQLGVTTDDLQRFRFMATQVGIEQEEMDKGLAKLTLTIGKAADGAKGPTKTFADLGISARDAGGNIKTAGAALPEIADALSKIPDPAERARLEVELFGKTGQKLDTLLAGGSGAINALSDAADRAGVVLSPELIQRADDAADKLAAVQAVLSAQIATTVAENSGAILELGNSFATLAGNIPDVVHWLERAKLKIAEYQDALGQYNYSPFNPFVTDASRGAAAKRLATTRSALSKFDSDRVLEGYAERFPLPASMRPGRKAPSAASSGAGSESVAGRSGGTSRTSGARRTGRSTGAPSRITSLADRLKSELDDGGPFISAELAAAGADANALTATLASVDQEIAAIHTGLEGVDLGAMLSEEEQGRLEEFAQDFRRDLAGGLTDAIVNGRDLGDVLVNSLKRAAAALIESGLLKLLGGGSSGTGTGLGGVGGLINNFLGGGFAGGGDPPVNKISLVGERGPELFVPKMRGTIIPNHALGGGNAAAAEPQRVVVSVEASPLFVAKVAQGTRAAGAEGARLFVAGATRPRLAKGAGAA